MGINIEMDKIEFSAEYFTKILKKEINPLPPKLSKRFKDFFYNVSPNNNDLIIWLSNCEYQVSQISLSHK